MAQIKVISGASISVSAYSHHACETGVVYTELANRDSRHYCCCHSNTVPVVDSRWRFVPNNIYNRKQESRDQETAPASSSENTKL